MNGVHKKRKTYAEILKERRNAISIERKRERKEGAEAMGPVRKGRVLGAVSSEARKHLQNTDLSPQQVDAFREVFSLFDSNGGGTIDAGELDETLKSVGIMLQPEEVVEVMTKIDKDGNGEIDFWEFLELMTNTEKFLESMASDRLDEEDMTKSMARTTLLFEALHQFMKKSALNSIQEIVGYYNTKYKKVQAPHVIGHYADGARLIGLTEKQLVQHLENLRVCNAGQNQTSPYAQPVYTWFQQQPAKSTLPKAKLLLANGRQKNTGRIRLTVQQGAEPPLQTNESTVSNSTGQQRPPTTNNKEQRVPSFRGKCWVSQRTVTTSVKLPLKKHFKQLKEFDMLTAEDLSSIREKVLAAKREYVSKMNECRKRAMIKHWKTLDSEAITSNMLREHYKDVFVAYHLPFKNHILPIINKQPSTA